MIASCPCCVVGCSQCGSSSEARGGQALVLHHRPASRRRRQAAPAAQKRLPDPARLGDLSLQAVTPKHLQDLYAELLASGRADGSGGLSPRSVRLAHQVLRSTLDRAADWRLIARNPAAAKLDLPRMVHRPMQTWTADEARQFALATADERHHVLWALMLSTGLRRGEALGLRWADVDLDARAGRRSALMHLASQIPAAVMADMLHLHVTTAVHRVATAGGDWSTYAAQVARGR